MNESQPRNDKLLNSNDESVDPRAVRLHELLDEYRSLIADAQPTAIDRFIADHKEFESELRELTPLADVLAGWSSDAQSNAIMTKFAGAT